MQSLFTSNDWESQLISSWFPKLPKYNSYLERSKRLIPVMIKFLEKLSDQVKMDHRDDVIDSCPIEITSKHRCKQSKTAHEIATHSFCASKCLNVQN